MTHLKRSGSLSALGLHGSAQASQPRGLARQILTLALRTLAMGLVFRPRARRLGYHSLGLQGIMRELLLRDACLGFNIGELRRVDLGLDAGVSASVKCCAILSSCDLDSASL